MYQFTFTVDEKDYFDFNIYHAKTVPSIKKIVRGLQIMLPVMLALMLLITYRTMEPRQLGFLVTIYVISSVIWWFLVKPLYTGIMKMMLKLMKKDGRMPFGKNCTIQFGEEVIFEKTEASEMKINYATVEKNMLNRNALYIYISSSQAFIIPFSAFSSDEQKSSFLCFLAEKTGKPVQPFKNGLQNF